MGNGVATAPDRRWIIALVIGTIGIAAAWYGPIQILLPNQADRVGVVAGIDRENLLAVVMTVGSIGSMVANPLWGLWSDRLMTTRNTRVPVILAGGAVGIAGLLVLAAADTRLLMLAGWFLVQAGTNGPFAVFAAYIADRVPEERRGTVGSLFAVGQLVGTVVGTAVAVVAGEGRWGYVAIAVAFPLLGGPMLLVGAEKRPHPDAVTSGTAASGAAASGTAADGTAASGTAVHRSAVDKNVLRNLRLTVPFCAAFGLRFLMNFVTAIGMLYMYYFLQVRAGLDDPGTWQLVLTVIYVAVSAVAAVVAGPLSDALGDRLTVSAIAAIVLAAGVLSLAFFTDLVLIVVSVAVVGIGYGLYLGVDVAIVTATLDDDRTRGTLLGAANIAATLPQVLGPVVAAPIVRSAGGYPALYMVAATIAVACLALLPGLRRTSGGTGDPDEAATDSAAEAENGTGGAADSAP